MVDNLSILANLVTILGLPLAIAVFWNERSKERENEERLIYENLSSGYDDFLKLLLRNADLRLWTVASEKGLDERQTERLLVLFEILVSLFERAYILSYSKRMTCEQARRWAAWDSYIQDWCKREDFRMRLPDLLRGSNPSFSAYVMQIMNDVIKPTNSDNEIANNAR